MSGRLRIKLCGVRRPEDALLCAEAGADEVGVVLAPRSRRCVSLRQARDIRAALPSRVPLVGVFQDATAAQLIEAVRSASLSAVQLHGALPPAASLSALAVPIYRALHLGRPDPAGPAAPALDAALDSFARLLLDGPGGGGGGERFDWRSVPSLRGGLRLPVFIAGGLDPDNVAAAIAAARPDGVDVASGVEGAGGFKDPARVRAFVAAARAAAGGDEGAVRWT